jgi:hypothetical protein
MTPQEGKELAHALATGAPTAVYRRHLDSLLIWLGNWENPRVAALDAAIHTRGMRRLEARERGFAMLEKLLFSAPFDDSPEAVLGLSKRDELVAVKVRYRHLVQAYHPDRHPEHAHELNQRLEQINAAYEAIERRQHAKARAHACTTSSGAPPPLIAVRKSAAAGRRHRRGRRRRRQAGIGIAIANRLRGVLGNRDAFETRFFAVLALTCLLLLGVLVYQSKTPLQRTVSSVMAHNTARSISAEPHRTRVDETRTADTPRRGAQHGSARAP